MFGEIYIFESSIKLFTGIRINTETVLLTALFFACLIEGCASAQVVAPDFTLSDVDGVNFSLSDYRGKVVILDFFATWCSPCVVQIPRLKSLSGEFGEDLVIISIGSPSNTVDELQDFRQEHEMDWIVARDGSGVFDKYDIQYIPTLVIVDQEGYIRHRHVGLTDESVLHEEINNAIPEFSSCASIICLVLAVTLALAIYRRSMSK